MAKGLEKIVINTGVGKIVASRRASRVAQEDAELVADIQDELAAIAGQYPQIVRARRSIAGFKLRKGMIAGLRVTLRRQKMRDFLSRIIRIALPRMRDFRGIPLKSVDRNGNLTLGIPDHTIFPEAIQTNLRWGMEATLVPSGKNRDEAIELYRELGVPLKNG